ncbi:hypothetical protein DLREEDagrD3_17270 [Denitratisoma sp. agr-D3]
MEAPIDGSEPRPPSTEETTAAQVVDLNPIPTFVIDRNHVVIHWNRACELLTGFPATRVVGTSNHWQPFYPTQRPAMADLLLLGANEAEVDRYYHGKFRPSELNQGTFEAEDFFPGFPPEGRWLFFTAALLRDTAGNIIGAIETLQDVTARRQAEIALQRERALMAAIINGSSVASIVIDRDHTIVHMNRAYETLFEVSAKDLIGTKRQWFPAYPEPRPILADLLLDGASPTEVAKYYDGHFHASQLIPGAIEAEGHFPDLGTNGRWLYLTAAPLVDDHGEVSGVIETLQDITERKQAEIALMKSEERYRQLSVTDELTGLGNLRSCYEHLEREIYRCNRYASPLSVLLLDVDNFKQYNDTWGHLEGDNALKTMATTIRRNLRKTDGGYRYGGEEFVVLLPETPLSQAVILAERIRLDFASTLLHPASNVAVSCTVSIGATELLPNDTMKSFLYRADEGTYKAKAQGKNRIVAIPP